MDFNRELTPQQFVERVAHWRHKASLSLIRKGRQLHMEDVSHWLLEFQNQRFEEVEVFGQYLQVKQIL
jgi:transformation/transcription domain-associated protein